MSEHVILLFGTENHDNPRAFELLSENLFFAASNFKIIKTPEVFTLETTAGNVQIVGLPGFDKGRLRTFMPEADKETENQNATALINEILLGLSTKLDKSKPSVLVGHYTVAGSEAENGSTFLAGQDVAILPQTIDLTGVTLACFGHIHKPQKLNCNTPAYYSGSPNQLTFNDEHDKHGFSIHEIKSIIGENVPCGGTTSVLTTYHETPERRHKTVKLMTDDIGFFIAEGKLPGEIPTIKDAIVRVKYNATAEQDKALNKAALQKHLIDSGAFHVAEIFREDAEDETLAEGVNTNDTPTAVLHRYLTGMKERGQINDTDIERLEELAAPIILKADDGRDSDQHAGAFIPKRIEIKNYRSYTAAEFDFSETRMAMVNGQNGTGKSSLFMDAIVDCLYEESRDGQIGGWLREGEKSGSIIFEFEMGGAAYRVARTRTKSGKGTLIFNRRDDNEEWTDAGDSTMKLTQAKINQTLGMDYQTFCSIAIIRQDAYGIFLETDSDRRMEVLSSLLNLGIYTRAEELAKNEATEQRRKIASIKDRMSVLDEQMSARENIESELKDCEKQSEETKNKITALEAQINAAQREETLRAEIIRQADEKAQEAQKLNAQYDEKEIEHRKLTTERDEAKKLAAKEEAAAEAVKKVEAARSELEKYAESDANLRNVKSRREILKRNKSTALVEINRLNTEREKTEKILFLKDGIAEAAKTIEEIRKRRTELPALTDEYDKAVKAVADRKGTIDTHINESGIQINELTAKVHESQKKAALLEESGCPITDKASCAFLKDAQQAKARLLELQAQLEEIKTAAREKYEPMATEYKKAKALLDGMSNPHIEADALTEKENEIASKAALVSKVEAAEATIVQLEQQKADKNKIIEESETEIAEIDGKLTELERNAEKAAYFKNEIKVHELIASLHVKCAAAKVAAELLGNSVQHIEKDMTAMRENAEKVQRESDDIRAKLPTEQTNLSALSEEKNRHTELSSATAQKVGALKNRLEAITASQKQWEEYRDETKVIARTLNDYQTLAGAFGIDGIQYVIIRSIVPEIMQRANAILAAMTGGRMAVDFRTEREQKSSAKIVNSLDVWINSLSGGSRPYNSHSGGEKVKIALAVTLGLADVKARRAGVQLGMLFIDEPPFLDADGTEAYADALTSMASRNPDMRILAISHDPTLKARFIQNIIVEAGEDGSTVCMV